ncbi:lariat debranching enzyme-like [Malus sylvestris]|uniref:lariat debranching enzyme-like n=1 Tax=Malus sylvestris TaxID=3752 RepID=UPI0021AC80D8|nr:lariat debranching enzyme-like [Malus sylvestris]
MHRLIRRIQSNIALFRNSALLLTALFIAAWEGPAIVSSRKPSMGTLSSPIAAASLGSILIFSRSRCISRYYGGWAAPNIYFLGFAGVVKFGNLRIGGLSGIYKQPDFLKGHFDRPPYNGHTIRSVYHVREYDFHKLMQVEEPVDIFLSHDCPVGITDCGDWKELVREKPDFKQEIQERNLGSKPAAQLLEKLKPPYWFSADLHCKFAARVQHGEDGSVTNFLALDKCLPGRKFLQLVC